MRSKKASSMIMEYDKLLKGGEDLKLNLRKNISINLGNRANKILLSPKSPDKSIITSQEH